MNDNSLLEARPEHANNYHFLRFALATAVLLSHSFELLGRLDPFARLFGPGNRLGATAVAGFFLISGCLIAASWERRPHLPTYLAKRCRRIVPGFVGAFLVSVLVVGPLGGNPRYWSEFSVGRSGKALLTFNAPVTPSVFLGQLCPLVNGSLWTIRYELACYLVVAALGLVGMFRARWAVLSLTVLVLAVYLVQCPTGILELGQGEPLLNLLVPVPRLLGCFLVGVCVHLYSVRFTGPGCWIATCAFLVANQFGFTATQAAIPLAGGYLLFAVAHLPSRLLRAWNGWPDISYGLYLYAWPIQMLLVQRFPAISPMKLFVASFALSILAGTVSWYGVERWFVRTRPRSGGLGSDPGGGLRLVPADRAFVEERLGDGIESMQQAVPLGVGDLEGKGLGRARVGVNGQGRG